ncbi:hypothetical protein KIL84_020758 [Mauremys mutica]|uniref:Uncharacterized protein n=1 Tax=Mauremys mutica TaxID=74926 RepID=A0A9D4B038_9SAUR|nr:hypothetical protein KIL84_020758 [Mauremys mutica]
MGGYSLITPNVLRVESEETVVVEAHGLSAPIVVTVTVHDFPLKKHILYQVQTDLNPVNGMMGTALIQVPTKNITKDSRQNQYVVVQAKFPQQTLEKVVLVHFHSGYVFIQTDKTIYTPGSTVLYRIFTVGHKLEPVSKRVIVEFEIEDGEGEATLTRAMLQARFANLNELVGHSLYVSVTVLTESGSNMVEAERTGINIVTSPYQIHFTKTPKYFKPGMPFELMVYITNPDGSPAPRVPVQAEGFQSAGPTQGDGTAKLIINMPRDRQQVPVTVKTAHPNLPANRQASKSMVAEAYQSQGGSQNYLHLAVTASELKPGDNLLVNFHLKSNNPAVLNQIQYFTYIILNKGKIIRVGRQARQAGQNLVTMSLPITPDLIPSFRIVAYYQVGNSEIVADSVWLDIQDTCMGTKMPFFLKDSITTWEVLAVSLSETKGICVADPYEIKVMKKFFIDLHLPYSVVRNEHVEIRAILYNYWDQNLKSLEGSISKAADYLAQRYQSLTRPYTVALVSYALAMVGTLDTEKTLMRASTASFPLSLNNNNTNKVQKKINLGLILQLKWNEDFTVKAEGTGQATVTVMIIYNAKLREDESQCKKFDLRVSVEEARGATLQPKQSCYFPTPTQVSHKEDECLQFKAHQFFEVGLIQPASVTVYDYYSIAPLSPVTRLLLALTQAEIHQCREGS